MKTKLVVVMVLLLSGIVNAHQMLSFTVHVNSININPAYAGSRPVHEHLCLHHCNPVGKNLDGTWYGLYHFKVGFECRSVE
jgi:hypothetical protein